MMEALAAMSTWKLIALGLFGTIALLFIGIIVLGTVAILGPGMRAVHGAMGAIQNLGEKRQRPKMPISVRVLGVGIVFLAVGLGIVIALVALPAVGGWGMFGVLMLSIGAGLVIFYLIAAKTEKQAEGADQAHQVSPDQQQ